MTNPAIFNFATTAATIAFTTMGVAFGGSISSMASIKAIYIQPGAKNDILKMSVLGMALTETAAIIGFVLAILLLTGKPHIGTDADFYASLSNLGIAAALGISGFTIGIASSFPVKYACLAAARQPFFSNKIINIMLLTLSFIQTPVIFGFVISLLIYFNSGSAVTLADSLKYIGGGLSIGLGSIGPAMGLALFSKSACQGIGINRDAYSKILSFTFISEALIETPVVFALVTSLLLVSSPSSSSGLLQGLAMLAAGLCTGISNIMPGISSGRTAASACEQIAYDTQKYASVSRTSMLAQGLIDSFAIYGWIISLMLIFFVK